MTTLLSIVTAMLGIYLSMRAIAALYRVIDVWYAMRTEYGRVLRGLVIWVGGSIAIAFVLPDRYFTAFIVGLAGYLVFYLVVFSLWHVLVRRVVARNLSASTCHKQ
jgi:hypothetical protein